MIGRHPACDLRRDNPHVSGEHAIVRWLEGKWELRDLNSKNGTFLGERRLSSGERVILDLGAVFSLGNASLSFALVDASPPVPGARNRRSGAMRVATDHVLVLPDDDHPIVTIFEDETGRWVAEREDATEPVRDHDLLIVDGEGWVLELPSGVRETWIGSAVPALETVGMRFVVSRDEENVDVFILMEDKEVQLPGRTYHYLMLTLARLREGDQGLPPEERGWVSRDALCRMLTVDPLKLNVDICRARKQLAEVGVLGAAGLIVRRPTSGQIRLGVDRIQIVHS